MDKIKLEYNYCPNFKDFNSGITIFVDENKDIAKLIAKEKRVLSQRKIGFVSSLERNSLLDFLSLIDHTVLLILRDVGTNQFCFATHLSIFETKNSIVWNSTQNTRKNKISFKYQSPLIINFPVDEDLPPKIPAIHFEFDKNQYYKTIGDYIDKLYNVGYYEQEFGSALDIIRAKTINNKRLIEALAKEQYYLPFGNVLSEEQCGLYHKLLSEEQYYLLEDYLLPKGKNDRKKLNVKQLSYNTNIFQ